MKKRIIFLAFTLVFTFFATSTPRIDAADTSDCVTFGVVTYDAQTGVETFEEFSYPKHYAMSGAQDDLVMSVPETVANNPVDFFEPDDINDNMEENDGELVSPNVIYDDDNSGDGRWRVTNPSQYGMYRNICQLEITLRDGSVCIGSGFVLSDSVIVTAGHCVYEYITDSQYGAWVSSIRVAPAYENGFMPYGSVTATSFTCGNGWRIYGDKTQDWGLIHVSNNFTSRCGRLGMRYQPDSYVGSDVFVAGYPKEIGDSLDREVNGMYMYADRDTVDWDSSSIVSYSKVDTSNGQSGAPVFRYYSDTGYTTIAINRGIYNGRNSGVRLSKALYDHLKEFR